MGPCPTGPTWTCWPGAATTFVVIDCPEFPCHAGEPFTCDDPYHYEHNVDDRGSDCACAFYWYWAHDDEPMDLNRLTKLGYRIPDIAPEENRW